MTITTAAAKNRIKSRFFKANPFRPAGDEKNAGNHIFIYFADAGNHSFLRSWKNFLGNRRLRFSGSA